MTNWPSIMTDSMSDALTVVNPRRHDAPCRHEVGAQGVHDEQIGLLPDLERAEPLSPDARRGRRLAVASARMSSGCGCTPGNGSLRRMRSVSSATRITSNRSLVLLSVPLAMGQPAARSAGIGGMTPRFAAIAA